MKSKCVRNAFYQLVKDYGKVLFVIGGFLLCLNSYAQIGINTSDPNATLEIIAQKRPQTPDGLLVPRLTATETKSMDSFIGEKQNSLLIYVTKTFTTVPTTGKCVNIDSEGYYFYHHLSGQATGIWKKLASGGGGGNYTAGAGIEIASGVISATGLESVPVTAGIVISNGWRLIKEDHSKHLSLGKKAVDMSTYVSGNKVGAGGEYSFAVGKGTKAKGSYSIAMGADSEAQGQYSIAMGLDSEAQGQYSIAMGLVNVIGGQYSIGIGYQNQTLENGGVAIGSSNREIGRSSYAIGDGNKPKGNYSYTIGKGNNVTTDNSMSIGFYNKVHIANIFSIGTGVGNNDSDRRNALVISKLTKNETTKPSRNFVAIGKDTPSASSEAIFQVNGLIQSEDINEKKNTIDDPSRVVVADNNGVLKTAKTSDITGVYLPSPRVGELIEKPFAGLYGKYFHGIYKELAYRCWKYIGYAKLISFADIVDGGDNKAPEFNTITTPKRLAPFVGGEYYVRNIPLNIVINPAFDTKRAAGQIKYIHYHDNNPLYREHGRVIYPFHKKGATDNFDYQGSSFILAIMRYTIGKTSKEWDATTVTIEFIPYTPDKYDKIKIGQPSSADNTDDKGTYYYPVLLQPKLVVVPAKPIEEWSHQE